MRIKNWALTVACCLTTAGRSALHAQSVPFRSQPSGNPIIQTAFTADPAPLVYNDTVYLYTSHDEDDAPDVGFKMLDWKCFTSTDMANWTDHGPIAAPAIFNWASGKNAWAPQCIYRNGKFYLYCPVEHKDHNMAIGVAVSSG